jgi:hypothetical protein
MTELPFRGRSSSPFSPEERETIERVYQAIEDSNHANAANVCAAIVQQVSCLEQLGEVLAQYPSPAGQQRLGGRKRGLDTLVDALSRSNFANFDFLVPTRALVGRAVDRAEANFYRLLGHVCEDVLAGDQGKDLREQASKRLRVCLYTMLAEVVLTTIAADEHLDREVRCESVLALAQIWDRRLTYRVSDFFPVLDAAWEARRRIQVVGGTLAGTHEIFELFREGCDPDFVEYFTRPDPSADEVEAFREFLFASSAEDLGRLAETLANTAANSIALPDRMATAEDDATVFYEFFYRRHLLATARRLSNQPGPKRTAEGYVMLDYLRQSMARGNRNRAATRPD